jgi:hypothetical protein
VALERTYGARTSSQPGVARIESVYFTSHLALQLPDAKFVGLPGSEVWRQRGLTGMLDLHNALHLLSVFCENRVAIWRRQHGELYQCSISHSCLLSFWKLIVTSALICPSRAQNHLQTVSQSYCSIGNHNSQLFDQLPSRTVY